MDIERFRPMLSASLPSMKKFGRVPRQEEVMYDLIQLDWSDGMWVSPKIDGIRAVKHPDLGLVSRTLKPIPNAHIQKVLSDPIFNHMDGELIKGDLTNLETFNDNQSAIMSEGGEPHFTYCVFDYIKDPTDAFWARTEEAKRRIEVIQDRGCINVQYVQHHEVKSPEALLELEYEYMQLGFEGVIIRHPYGRYKNNRSTFRQQGMIKIKRFVDAEATIIGFKELERNTNAPQIDLLGYTKRTAHKAGRVEAGTLGKFQVRGINGEFAGKEFECGSGLDDATRDAVWRDRDAYLYKVIKYKYQPTGSKDKPRSPIFLGFRSVEDM